MLSYILASLISFSGLLAGMLIGVNTKEELPKGQPYLEMLQKALLAATIGIAMNAAHLQTSIKIAGYALIIIALSTKLKLPNPAAYGIMGIALFFSSSENELLATAAALIFIFGLATGSLCIREALAKKKKTILQSKKELLKDAIFLVSSIIPAIIF